jgi:hypothetical protein
MQAVRRAIERDRYGLVSQVLLARERCTPMECATYRSLTDNHQIITNMDEHLYDSLVARYAPTWTAPQAVTASTASALGMLPPSAPTGRPTNAEFPSAANTPAVSIMAPEPGTGAKVTGATPPAQRAEKPAQVEKPAQAERPAQAAAPQSIVPPYSPPPAPAKKTAAKRAPAAAPAPAAPTSLSPAPSEPPAAND